MIFEKLYIISYIKNDQKRNKIKNILNKLSITEFEFIYGIDMNISDIYKTSIYDEREGNIFKIENTSPDTYASHAISCGIAHFTALQHAYYSNINNCLIIEDDVLLYNDLIYVNNVLSYYPENADIIQYGFISLRDNKNEIYDKYYEVGKWYAGTQAYAVCNRYTLEKLINNYLNIFYESDNYNLYNDMKIFNTNIPIFIDPIYNNDLFYNYN